MPVIRHKSYYVTLPGTGSLRSFGLCPQPSQPHLQTLFSTFPVAATLQMSTPASFSSLNFWVSGQHFLPMPTKEFSCTQPSDFNLTHCPTQGMALCPPKAHRFLPSFALNVCCHSALCILPMGRNLVRLPLCPLSASQSGTQYMLMEIMTK